MRSYDPSKMTELDFALLKEKYDREELEKVLEKIENDYPVQYAIGDVPFLGWKILVDERVLIPRFETELLCEKLINYIERCGLGTSNIIDICTGSGCIAVALKKKFPYSSVTAIDVSEEALEVASGNARENDAEIDMIKLEILKENISNKHYDVLVANPPYVSKDEIVSPNTRYEPSIALYPSGDPTMFYYEILKKSKTFMNKKHIIAFEIGATQAQEVSSFARKFYPSDRIVVVKDYNGLERFVFLLSEDEY